MKTWEMIKELTECPKKKFRSSSNNVIMFKDGNLVYEKSGNKFIIFLFNAELGNGYNGACDILKSDWQEVVELVSFDEAKKDVEENDAEYKEDSCMPLTMTRVQGKAWISCDTKLTGWSTRNMWIKQ